MPTPLRPPLSPEQLRRRRLAAGLTQRELAARVGVTQSRLSALESGRAVAGSPVVRELLQQLDAALEEVRRLP